MSRFREFIFAHAMGVFLTFLATSFWVTEVSAENRAERIKIEYEPTKVKEYTAVRELVMKERVLEQIQTVMAPIRLPKMLNIKTGDCDGEVNAFYEDGNIRICYEIIGQLLYEASSKSVPKWTDRNHIVAGSLSVIILHEAAHAVFHLLDVPILGREEDAADQLATYLLLGLGKANAPKLIAGSVYIHLRAAGGKDFRFLKRKRLKLVHGKSFADEHSVPAQRMYNMLCLSFGAAPELFENVVKQGALPMERAEQCEWEFKQIDLAFNRLIMPHVDKAALLRYRFLNSLSLGR